MIILIINLITLKQTQPQQPQQLPQPQPMPQDIPVQPQPAYTPAVAPSAANPQDLLAALAPLLAQTGLVRITSITLCSLSHVAFLLICRISYRPCSSFLNSQQPNPRLRM